MGATKRRLRRGWLGMTALFVMAILAGVLAGTVAGYLKNAPTLDQVRFSPKLASLLYDSEGRVFARLYQENRVPVKLSQIPKTLREAVLSMEDESFYRHRGVNPWSILRALVADLRHGSRAQGGSTITQQLAKNTFLTSERTLSRKLKEAFWAIQIERKYTKDEILEAYLNEIYLGHGAYGVEAAAQLYFGKSVTRLSLPESALIAGILRGPSLYSPFEKPEVALKRRNLALDRMVQTGVLPESQAEQAKAAPLQLTQSRPVRTTAPYFVDYVISQLLERYTEEQIFAGGLRVYTTLDLDMQRAAEQALLPNLPAGYVDDNSLTQPQGALVAQDAQNGYIRAMIGGRGTDKFNRAVQALRQPGSAIKPFIYVAAIDKGYSPGTVFVDEPIRYVSSSGEWAPQNYDRKFRGAVTLREALEKSINTVAVQLADTLDIRTVIRYARNMGLNTLVENGPKTDLNLATALGGLTRGVSLMEMVRAYGVLANQGIGVDPVSILRVEDSRGVVLEQNAPKRRAVLSERTATIVTDMLRGVIEKGTGKRANIRRPAAGKTGTTQDYTNAWFIGYTPDLVAGVWIGNDIQTRKMVFGGVTVTSGKAAEIWGRFMSKALEGKPAQEFKPPPDEVQPKGAGTPGASSVSGETDNAVTSPNPPVNSGAEAGIRELPGTNPPGSGGSPENETGSEENRRTVDQLREPVL